MISETTDVLMRINIYGIIELDFGVKPSGIRESDQTSGSASYQSPQPVRSVPQQAAHPAQSLLHGGLQVVSGPAAARGAAVRPAQRQAALEPLLCGFCHVNGRWHRLLCRTTERNHDCVIIIERVC